MTNKVGNMFTWTGKSKNNTKQKFSELRNIYSSIASNLKVVVLYYFMLLYLSFKFTDAMRGVTKLKDTTDKSIEEVILFSYLYLVFALYIKYQGGSIGLPGWNIQSGSRGNT